MPDTSMIGQTLLHYQVLSKLGEGGMGEVYLALDTKLERQVAIKVLPEELARSPRRWERFVREARAVAALNHPNIVTIFAVEEAAGRHFFAMELVEGQTLEELIPREGLPLDRFLAIAVPLVDALGAAHGQGILHRDLKPENVMVSRAGRVKVLDFGVAKAVRDERTEVAGEGRLGLTEEGAVLGTARYMSPEQACGEVVDPRSDLFSLGIIFYEMATGAYPFQGNNTVEVLSAILRDQPPAASSLRRDLPARLGAIIHRSLQKPRELRYGSAEEVARDLEALRREIAVMPRRDELENTLAEPMARLRPGERRPSAPSGGQSMTRPPASPALAVLPLTDLAGQPDYFVEGLTGELITAVAKVGSLRVISRQSVMRYRGSTKLLPEIAREIGVDHVLEGSVMRAGDRVRISLQLIRAEPEEHLWAEHFDRDLGDMLAVQSEVARAVAAEIRVKLSPSDEARLQPSRTVSPAVFEAYLKGRHHWSKRTLESLERAVICFQEAIEADPTHAPSYAGLADSWALIGQRRPGADLAARARAAARRALELDPMLAEAHTSLGFINYFYDWDWAGGERELRRALELSPNNANAHYWLWSLLVGTRRPDEARREIHRALEIDPLSAVIVTNYGTHHYMRRDYERALRQFHKALELEPGFFAAQLALWRAHEMLGDHDSAASALATALTAMGCAGVAAVMERVHRASGYGMAMETAADELLAMTTPPVTLEMLAWMYLANGRRDRALALVEEAFEKRRPGMVWMSVAPDWDPLGDEPRFHELVALVGLPPRQQPPRKPHGG
jgi:eukaryotic-like serine/threonine-protein kinase